MKKPNILLITSDQQHFDTIGAFNSEVSTPNLDRLVKEGTTFQRAYCPNPTCTPTRSSIITGTYPSQHGAWTLGTKLSEDKVTVGDVFRDNGYRTALVGKAHFQPTISTEEYPSLESLPLLQDIEFWKSYNQPFYGFEKVELLRNHTNEYLVGQHYVAWLEEKGYSDWKQYYMPPTGTMDPDIKYSWDIPEEYHYNTFIAEKTNELDWTNIKRRKRTSSFGSSPDPHPPYLAPEPWASMYDPDQLTIPEMVQGSICKIRRIFKRRRK